MLKIALLLGGKSTEHEISLKSSSFIFHTLDRNKYEVKPVLIDKKGNWLIPSNFQAEYPNIQSVIENFPPENVADEIEANIAWVKKYHTIENNHEPLLEAWGIDRQSGVVS